jgi:hypothetical protein
MEKIPEKVRVSLEDFDSTQDLLNYMSNVEYDLQIGIKRNLLAEAMSYADAIIYLFNTDKNFRSNVLKDPRKLFYVLVILVLSDNIDRAEKLADRIKTTQDYESAYRPVDILLKYYFSTYNYNIIDFLLNNYQKEFNIQIVKFSKLFETLSKEDINKFITDDRVDIENKNLIIYGTTDKLSAKDAINYFKKYTDIDDSTIFYYINRILYLNKDDRIDKLSYILKNYNHTLSSESIKALIETLIGSHRGKLTKDDVALLYMLLDVENMKFKK